jgi:Ser/Thr protein kinase RdoA (MazF antagonist)
VLGSFGAVVALPGAERQHIHRDHPPLFENPDLDAQVPSFAVTVVIPLVDLTIATGSTRVWKGSHRQYHSEDLRPELSCVPLAKRGSCYLMDYQLLHGGMPNKSNQIRPILYLNYYRSWFQEAVNYEQQSRILITPEHYQNIPQPYQFLFTRLKESLEFMPRSVRLAHEESEGNSFHHLSTHSQIKILTPLAQTALAAYGLDSAPMELINHGDNTIFKVAIAPPNAPPEQYALRIHRADYLSQDAIESELQWLDYLDRDAQLPIASPRPTLAGPFSTAAHSPELPEPRTCSLIHWLAGDSLRDRARSHTLSRADLEAVGRLLAQLHDRAARWTPPAGFQRPRWDWEGLFGKGAGYSADGTGLWDLVPPTYRPLFRSVSDRMGQVMAELGEGEDQFGLIHGDFWVGNLLVFKDEIRVIDFADCGWGYWGYDLARFLSYFIHRDDAAQCLAACLSGYCQIRPFPEQQLPYLYLFLAAQEVSLALWRLNRAQDHPSFRETLTEDLQEAMDEIHYLQALESQDA